MKKQITIVSFLFLALLLVAGGCKNKEKEETKTSTQEQKQEKSETVSDESVIEDESAFAEVIADEAKKEYEDTREKNKDCQRYAWSTMNEGPYRDKVSYATSTDLLSWTDSEQILAEHASVPGAVMKDGTIYVYHVDVVEECYAESLGLIKSEDDGKT